jgi:hypothetical protein
MTLTARTATIQMARKTTTPTLGGSFAVGGRFAALVEDSDTEEEEEDFDPICLHNTDLWIHKILPFLGPGHFIFVAGVNKRFKQLYQQYFARLQAKEGVPTIYADVGTRIWQTREIPATPTSTFFGAAFYSVSCAEFWKKNKGQHEEDVNFCRVFARVGKGDLLQWALQNIPKEKSCHEIYHRDAARAGNLGLMKRLHEIAPPDPEWTEWTYGWTLAAGAGHLGILKWLHQIGCPWPHDTNDVAARRGQLEVVQWLHEHGYPSDEWTCLSAAEGGHVDVLEWLLDNGCPRPWDDYRTGVDFMFGVAWYGHLEILKLLRQKGCPWKESVCAGAAYGGHLEVLQWLRENGCPWDRQTIALAANLQHYHVVIWARDNGCPSD